MDKLTKRFRRKYCEHCLLEYYTTLEIYKCTWCAVKPKKKGKNK